MKFSVIGLGKLGSPMLAVFAHKGFDVIGLDLNTDYVKAINDGQAPVTEPRLQEMIVANRERIRATADMKDAVLGSDVSFIIVPTPSGPDHKFRNDYVIEAVKSIGAALREKKDYHLVVVTSTTMPGSVGGPIREALEQASGRKVGPDMGLAYNPEFIALGSVVRDMLNPDMILIGENDGKAGDILESIYRKSTDSNPEIKRMNWVNAELCKISVNTYVTTKISYANMIADICDRLDGADADVVTDAVGADSRIGKKYLKGAIGYGGPCFPRDTKAFAALGRDLGARADLAVTTDAINQHQNTRLVEAIRAFAAPGAAVAILGLSYKPNTPVIEESQGLQLAEALVKSGYTPVITDPEAMTSLPAALTAGIERAQNAEQAIARADVVAIMTPWAQYREIPASAFGKGADAKVVVDPWRVVDASALAPEVTLVRLGVGDWRHNAAERVAAE